MRRIALVLALLSAPVFAQSTSNYNKNPALVDQFVDATITAQVASCTADGAIKLKTAGLSTAGVVITGSGSWTVTFKAAADDNVTYNTIAAYPQAGGASVTTATAAGTWLIGVAGYKWLCVYPSTWASGNPVVHIEGSAGIARNISGADVATIGGAAYALGTAAMTASIPVTIATDDVVGTSLAKAQAATITSAKGPMVQGSVTTSAPTYTTAQINPLSLATTGSLRVTNTTDANAIGSTTVGEVGPLVQGAAITADPTTTTGGTYPLSMDVLGALRVTGRTRPVAYGASPTATTATTPAQMIQDLEGRQYVNVGHPRAINCYLADITGTTSTQITGCELVASNSIYITSVTLTGDAISTTSTPAILQSGTSTACTGPRKLFSCWHAAMGSCTQTFNPPIKVVQAEGLCILDGSTGSKSATVDGYVAP